MVCSWRCCRSRREWNWKCKCQRRPAVWAGGAVGDWLLIALRRSSGQADLLLTPIAVACCSNVTIGGYGQIWAVPLSTAAGKSLYGNVQYPWRGEALLRHVWQHKCKPAAADLSSCPRWPAMAAPSSAALTDHNVRCCRTGNLTGPFFGLEKLHSVMAAGGVAYSPSLSQSLVVGDCLAAAWAELARIGRSMPAAACNSAAAIPFPRCTQLPNPDPVALQVAGQFNAAAAAASSPDASDAYAIANLQQVHACCGCSGCMGGCMAVPAVAGCGWCGCSGCTSECAWAVCCCR